MYRSKAYLCKISADTGLLFFMPGRFSGTDAVLGEGLDLIMNSIIKNKEKDY